MDDIEYHPVTVRTASPFVLAGYDRNAPGPPVDLPAGLYLPATVPPPWPAAVVSEGLGGVKTARERRYGRFLAQHGCAALVVDSFHARGYRDMPDPIRALFVTETMMLADAFAGLSFLAARDDVDGARIFNVGFSYGGMIAILTAYEQLRRTFLGEERGFAGHVSYYGPTVPRLEDPTTTGAPVVVLNGERDDNLNQERLALIVEDLRRGGSPVTNVIFPEAFHQWDSDDHEKRFDRFNLCPGAVTIRRDGTIFDEIGQRPVRGFFSRVSMLYRCVSLAGFFLRRNEEAMRESDRLLLETIGLDGHAAAHHEVATPDQTTATAGGRAAS